MNTRPAAEQTFPSRREWAAVLFALVFPSILTYAYFVALAGESAALQQSTYAVGKIVQFGFPALWVGFVARERLRVTAPSSRGMGIGLIFGVGVVLVMLALHQLCLRGTELFARPEAEVPRKIAELGIDSVTKFAALGVFYSLFHSLLEEYYWRWFVFARLRTLTKLPTAVVVSSVGFTAHHVIVLATYFGWSSPFSYVFSAAVCIGGAFWAWSYHRSRSLYAPWLSHAIVDAGIFLLGYRMVRDTLVT